MTQRIRRLRRGVGPPWTRPEAGQMLVEYGLIIVLVVIAVMAAVGGVGGTMDRIYRDYIIDAIANLPI